MAHSFDRAGTASHSASLCRRGAALLLALLGVGSAGCQPTVSYAYRGTASLEASRTAPVSELDTQTVELNRCPDEVRSTMRHFSPPNYYSPGLLRVGSSCSIVGHWNERTFFGRAGATCNVSIDGQAHVLRVTDAVAHLDLQTSGRPTDVDTGYAQVTIGGDDLGPGEPHHHAVYKFAGPRVKAESSKTTKTSKCDVPAATREVAKAR